MKEFSAALVMFAILLVLSAAVSSWLGLMFVIGYKVASWIL